MHCLSGLVNTFCQASSPFFVNCLTVVEVSLNLKLNFLDILRKIVSSEKSWIHRTFVAVLFVEKYEGSKVFNPHPVGNQYISFTQYTPQHGDQNLNTRHCQKGSLAVIKYVSSFSSVSYRISSFEQLLSGNTSYSSFDFSFPSLLFFPSLTHV